MMIKRQDEKSATKMELGMSVEGSTPGGNRLMVGVGLYYCYYTLKIFKCSYLKKADGLH